MQIFINETEVDFTLENEASLFEVVASIDGWLMGQNALMLSVAVDDKEIPPVELQFLNSVPPGDAEKIAVLSLPVEGIENEQLQTTLAYIHRLIHSIINSREEVMQTPSLEGCLWLTETVSLLIRMHVFELVVFRKDLETLQAERVYIDDTVNAAAAVEAQERVRILTDDFFQRLLQYCAIAREMLSDVVRKMTRPVSEASLKRLESVYQAVAKTVGDVSEMLQTGKEQEALSVVEQTAMMLDMFFFEVRRMSDASLIDVAAIAQDGVSLQQWNDELLPVAREIIEALENNDTVLLGDLFEYELKEKLPVMGEFIAILQAQYAASA